MPFKNRLSRLIRKSGSGSGSGSDSGSSSGSSGSRSSDGQAESRSHTASPTTTATTSSSMPRPPKGLVRSYTSAASRLSKKPTWLTTISYTTHDDDVRSFSPGHKPHQKRSSKSAVKSMHPSERRLNEQNMRHQEMLGLFTMKFGRGRRSSCDARSEFSGISPCNSRTASMDIG